jgi:chemotaxis protein MotB
VVFESGSADLKPDIMPLMVRLLEHLREMENTIIVEGHTDDIPISTGRYRSNWELSAARAFSVIHFYIDREIRPDRLAAHGYGPYRPLMPNTTDLRRAINRRIEITILRGA